MWVTSASLLCSPLQLHVLSNRKCSLLLQTVENENGMCIYQQNTVLCLLSRSIPFLSSHPLSLSHSLSLSGPSVTCRESGQVGASDGGRCSGTVHFQGWRQRCHAGRSRRRFLHHRGGPYVYRVEEQSVCDLALSISQPTHYIHVHGSIECKYILFVCVTLSRVRLWCCSERQKMGSLFKSAVWAPPNTLVRQSTIKLSFFANYSCSVLH